MIENSSFEDEYFIVLKPEGEILTLAKYLQKIISERYNLYPNDIYPEIHITLDRIKNDKLSDAIKITDSIVAKYNKIDITVKKFNCFSFKENNFLVLNVIENKKLLQFGNELHNELVKKNISTIKNYKEWKFHISLASTVFSDTKYDFNKDFKDLCLRFEDINIPRTSKARIIEIWRPTLDETKKCIKRFRL
ncbi:MAG: 2'-5' RNA ligase family protein [Halanaerobiales bacterium]|nr:2'-5' RNA ligase family protein [Halanaerobiales bacterium]